MKKSYLLFTVYCLLFTVFLWGCGGGGPGSPGSSGTEDTGVKVTITNVTHQYLDEDVAWQIDIVRDVCKDGTAEPFSDDFAVFDFEGTPLNPNSSLLPGDLHIETYSVEFFPQDPGNPPIEKFDGFAGFTIPANGTATGLDIFIIGVGRKMETLNYITSGVYSPQRDPMQYDMLVTFRGKNDHGDSFTEQYLTSVSLSDYAHCQ